MVIHFTAKSNAKLLERPSKHFVLSPMREISWALHVLSRPTDHGIFLRWILDVRQKMGSSGTENLDEMAPFFQGWVQAMIPLPKAGKPAPRFDEEWERYMGLNAVELGAVYERIRHRWTEEFDKRMARNSEWERVTPLTKPCWWDQWDRQLESLRDRLGFFMQHFWTRQFQAVWKESVPYLEHDINSRMTDEPDPRVWWQEISPRFRLSSELFSVDVHVPWKSKFFLKPTTDFQLFPSVFCWPHVWVDGDESEIGVTYQSLAVRRWAMPVPASVCLERTLEALSEPTRLLIVRHLIGSMSTTSAISHALRLSASTVSRHLTLLHSVGLVERIVHGHYVLYRANPAALERVALDLQSFRREEVPSFLGWNEESAGG
ncbi:MAG: DUF5937 family protein [Firmicutes bacterium]|nr:DUF5937 family protein [Bacillota bacterium]MCL5013722.1 DUF5937 family protein [Bacillota bacterium]